MENKQYLINADIIRIMAIFGAIGIHIVFPFYGRWDYIGGKIWWISDIWNAFARTSIPLFIILSGYFILNNQDSITRTWQRVIGRILIPLVFWSGLYLLWDGLYLKHGLNWQDFFLCIFRGGLFHYYFLGIIASLYILSPILRFILNQAPIKLNNYLIVISLAGSLLLNFYLYLTYKVFDGNIFLYWIMFVGYFLAGGLYRRSNLKVNPKSLSLVFIISWIFTSLAGWINLNLIQYKTPILFPAGSISPYFDHYVSPNIMIMSFCLFIFIMQANLGKIVNNRKLISLVKLLASASFGMYLIHPFIMDFMYMKFFIVIESLPLLLILKIVTTYLFSFIITIILLKIPKLNAVLGIKN